MRFFLALALMFVAVQADAACRLRGRLADRLHQRQELRLHRQAARHDQEHAPAAPSPLNVPRIPPPPCGTGVCPL